MKKCNSKLFEYIYVDNYVQNDAIYSNKTRIVRGARGAASARRERGEGAFVPRLSVSFSVSLSRSLLSVCLCWLLSVVVSDAVQLHNLVRSCRSPPESGRILVLSLSLRG